MGQWKVTATRELYFEAEVSAKTAADAASKLGDMIRADEIEPVDKVICDIDVRRIGGNV